MSQSRIPANNPEQQKKEGRDGSSNDADSSNGNGNEEVIAATRSSSSKDESVATPGLVADANDVCSNGTVGNKEEESFSSAGPVACTDNVATSAPTGRDGIPTADDSTNNASSSSVEQADNDNSDKDDKDAKKKKNRCAVCRKKVGLTGFECRCGGLFCAAHRYSDKHDCTFNYREMGAQEIRRNNPVVVGEKIQKI